MKIQLQVILTTCIVNFGFVHVESRNQIQNEAITNKVNDDIRTRENFKNLFDSIAMNDAHRKETYRDILKGEVIHERHAFDTMKNELWIARNKNSNKKRNLYRGNHNKGKIVVSKRGTNSSKPTIEENHDSQVERLRNITALENKFLSCHPNIDTITWEEMNNLTEESLKNVCDQVLPFLVTPSDSVNNNYTYEPLTYLVHEERTVQCGLLPIGNKSKMAHVPVIKCFYKEKKFYLTHASDGLVFELQCEDEDQEIYSMKSELVSQCVEPASPSNCVIYTSSSDDKVIYDEEKLEKIYYQLHPNIKEMIWPEADNLTAEVHKRICDQVLDQIVDSNDEKNYTFLSVPSHRIQSERIMREEPLLIFYTDVAHPIVIQCFYDKKRFYITKADDNHVFRVNLSRGTHVFVLESGLHPVKYN